MYMALVHRAVLRLLVTHLPWPLGYGATAYSESCARASGVPQSFWRTQGRACLELLHRRVLATERLALVAAAALAARRGLAAALALLAAAPALARHAFRGPVQQGAPEECPPPPQPPPPTPPPSPRAREPAAS